MTLSRLRKLIYRNGAAGGVINEARELAITRHAGNVTRRSDIIAWRATATATVGIPRIMRRALPSNRASYARGRPAQEW